MDPLLIGPLFALGGVAVDRLLTLLVNTRQSKRDLQKQIRGERRETYAAYLAAVEGLRRAMNVCRQTHGTVKAIEAWEQYEQAVHVYALAKGHLAITAPDDVYDTAVALDAYDADYDHSGVKQPADFALWTGRIEASVVDVQDAMYEDLHPTPLLSQVLTVREGSTAARVIAENKKRKQRKSRTKQGV